MKKKHRIQLGSIGMAFGAVLGFAASPISGIVLCAGMAVCGGRWRISFLCAITFAVGLLWGWYERPHDLISGKTYRGIVAESPRWAWSWVTVRLDEGTMTKVRSRGASAAMFGNEIDVACPDPWMRRMVYEVPRCRTAQINLVAQDRADVLQKFLHRTRSWLDQAITKSVPFPESALLSGILLGGRDDLPDTMADAFRTTGTSHIVAVSGYNVSIVVTLIATLFVRLPIPRSVRTLLVLVAVALFVILTGSTASVVRAGLMGSMVIVGRATGRLGDALHGLILCAVAMVIVTPAVVFDIGFQLSVAATFGLVVLSDPIKYKLRGISDRFGVRSSLATTLAAIAVTQPFIILYFGNVSLIAPLVNVVVLPLIPVAMALGAGAAVTILLIPSIAVYSGWIAWVPLHGIIILVLFFAQMPFASLAMPQIVSTLLAAAWMMWVAWFVGRDRRSHAQP